MFVPFSVGGGIRNLDDMYQVLKAGAEKISIDSMAVRNPNIINEGAAPWHSVHHLKYAGKASGKNEKYSFRL